MYLFQRILKTVRSWFQPKKGFTFDVHTLESIQLIAEREQRSPEEVAEWLLQNGLRHQQFMSESLALWQTLTPREQQVTALVCLHYTNRQIAAMLHISPETVKTHVGHVLVKLNLNNRNTLRQLFSELDFSEWEKL